MDKKKDKVLGETYEPGKPKGPYDWKVKFKTRKKILKYLKTAERYWYAEK